MILSGAAREERELYEQRYIASSDMKTHRCARVYSSSAACGMVSPAFLAREGWAHAAAPAYGGGCFRLV
jgi:hypothetical protein